MGPQAYASVPGGSVRLLPASARVSRPENEGNQWIAPRSGHGRGVEIDRSVMPITEAAAGFGHAARHQPGGFRTK
jgi:hypothetical protein